MADESDENPLAGRAGESANAAAGDVDPEEEVPDWLSFAAFAKNASRGAGSVATSSDPIIPKRGEKDFEPAVEDRHINLQTSLLDASRSALFTAISSGVRNHSSKTHNRAVWDAELSRAYMVDAPDPALHPSEYSDRNGNEARAKNGNPATVHGIHFQTIGRYEGSRRRMELLPEEVLYLLERGTVECWTGEDEAAVPMSVQHAWARMIDANGLNAERYQIYAFLRRLGYTVIRADFPRPASNTVALQAVQSFSSRLGEISRFVLQRLLYGPSLVLQQLDRLLFGPAIAALARLNLVSQGKRRSLVGGQRWFTYDQLFTNVQFVKSGKKAKTSQPAEVDNPYKVFFHVYKPVTRFKKTDPPEPDFRIAVINARTTPIPTVTDFARIFSELPLEPVASPSVPAKPGTIATKLESLVSYYLQALHDGVREALHRVLLRVGDPTAPSEALPLPVQSNKKKGNARPPRLASLTRPAPYARLKGGRKSAIVAVVDSGTISFQKFGETDFAELPWVGDGTLFDNAEEVEDEELPGDLMV